MRLILNKEFSYLYDNLFEQQDIPCSVMVGEDFTIIFSDGCEIIAKVQDWDLDKIQNIYPVRAGSENFLDEHAMITLSRIDDYTYHIEKLKFFSSFIGWSTVFENGTYVSAMSKFES